MHENCHEHKKQQTFYVFKQSVIIINASFFNPFTTTICSGLIAQNSPAGWARELFKPSTDVVSLVDSIFKNWKVLDLSFCGWRHNRGRFGQHRLALSLNHKRKLCAFFSKNTLDENPHFWSIWLVF